MINSHKLKFGQHITAVPGYAVLSTRHDDNGYPNEVNKAHIVAFAFEEGCEFSIPYPVTYEGVITDNVYLLRPDGTVDKPDGEFFFSLDDWLKSEQADYTAKHGGPK